MGVHIFSIKILHLPPPLTSVYGQFLKYLHEFMFLIWAMNKVHSCSRIHQNLMHPKSTIHPLEGSIQVFSTINPDPSSVVGYQCLLSSSLPCYVTGYVTFWYINLLQTSWSHVLNLTRLSHLLLECYSQAKQVVHPYVVFLCKLTPQCGCWLRVIFSKLKKKWNNVK